MHTMIFDILQRPEYIHVLINPLPLYGLAMGIVALVIGLLMRNRAAQMLALWLVFLSALSARPAYVYGHRAYHQVYVMANDDEQLWLDRHMHRADKLVDFFYVLAAVSLSAVAVLHRHPKTAVPLALIVLVLSAGTLAVGGWIAYSGGKIRHSEFRARSYPADTNMQSGTNHSH